MRDERNYNEYDAQTAYPPKRRREQAGQERAPYHKPQDQNTYRSNTVSHPYARREEPYYNIRNNPHQTFQNSPQNIEQYDQGQQNEQWQHYAYSASKYRRNPSKGLPVNLDSVMLMVFLAFIPLCFILGFFIPPARWIVVVTTVIGAPYIWWQRFYYDRARLILTCAASILAIASFILVFAPGERYAPPSSFQSTSDGGTGSISNGSATADLALSTFMAAWGNNSTEQMIAASATSWRSAQTSPQQRLTTILGAATLNAWDVVSPPSGASSSVTATVQTDVTINGTGARYQFTISLPYENGQWFVNPESFIQGTVIMSGTPEPTMMATGTPQPTQTPKPTQAPQSTPKAITAAQHGTTIYYNPSGGSYYHGDANCSLVKAEYLPLTPFDYGELEKKPFSSLKQCVACGAPSKTHSH